jgi:hypothetical protein
VSGVSLIDWSKVKLWYQTRVVELMKDSKDPTECVGVKVQPVMPTVDDAINRPPLPEKRLNTQLRWQRWPAEVAEVAQVAH